MKKLLLVVLIFTLCAGVRADDFGTMATTTNVMHGETNYLLFIKGSAASSEQRKISPSNIVAVQNTVLLPRTNLAGLTVTGGLTVDTINNANPTQRVGVWREIEIPAGAWQNSITNGADFATNNTLSTDYATMPAFDFDDTTSQSVEINLRMPRTWDLGTVKYSIDFFSGATAGTNAWELKAKSVADNESAAGTWGTGINVYKLVSTTANRQNSTTNSAALTIGGTPAVGERVYFKLSRLPGDAFDNLVGDARLSGLTIFYKESNVEPAAP